MDPLMREEIAGDVSAPHPGLKPFKYNPKNSRLKPEASDKDVLTLARERMRTIFERFDHVSVSFSGGKDSTIVLNLALEAARELGRTPLDVVFYDEECIYTENIDYVRRVAADPDVALRWICVPVKHRNACSSESPVWYPWAPEDRPLWVRELPPEAITEIPGYDYTDPATRLSIPEVSGLLFPPTLGNVVQLLGIRADESLIRRAAVSRRVVDNYIVKDRGGYGGANDVQHAGNVWKAYPIYDWRTEDVWLAPKRLGWDYCRVYDLLDQIGFTPGKQRLAPPFGEEPMQRLDQYHQCEPALWDRMLSRVPGAQTAKRYSRTELYAFGEIPEKPPGLTYEEWLRDLVTANFPEKEAAQVSKGIRAHLRMHYRKTADLLAPTVDHPLTGYSWAFFVKMAMRGNFKQRRQPNIGRKTPEQFQKDLAKYRADLARYQAELAEARALQGDTP
ncbi:phosphoadenosine phosphosulfate reductase family protein [Deinococcus sp. NW-56]|uniref:phosphoadenosine phosphosulfate reductase domain-containing protein n=1 Tax=Deinococcus sp. NW-56 TaxID=2080419 RepID=UPI000CF454C4|nr:phosphoadenosine phosphosulfate reductase family protein [Deinococcus sp. NW-56]